MSKQAYIDYTPRYESVRQAIRHAEEIVATYRRQGYILTLRQVYYQFVARDLFPDDRRWKQAGSKWVKNADGTKNADPNYEWLGEILNNARLGGLLDWDGIEDRTRNLKSVGIWASPASIMRAVASQFRIDKWTTQPVRIFCWVEKEALEGVVARPCNRNFVPYMSCRGYMSQSEMRDQARSFHEYQSAGQEIAILHLGDHDPSGIDMTRDIIDRMRMFNDFTSVEVVRIALNMDQVQQYNPPPNPAKLSDSRATGYIDAYGDESWELDALEPSVIDALIQQHIDDRRDPVLWREKIDEEAEHRHMLETASERWDEVVEYLRES